ncbi:hypothetical protein [Hymenobacter edaphi]|uniref:hypothetical protein n=1 Tax=Hymenobacter edaphi TaxID=2211146 RepID=UPI001A9E9DE6|nr:hypothetical protein [Hymenobacter edaphi]
MPLYQSSDRLCNFIFCKNRRVVGAGGKAPPCPSSTNGTGDKTEYGIGFNGLLCQK